MERRARRDNWKAVAGRHDIKLPRNANSSDSLRASPAIDASSGVGSDNADLDDLHRKRRDLLSELEVVYSQTVPLTAIVGCLDGQRFC